MFKQDKNKKQMANKNGHGGVRKGQGRPKKADEEKVRRLGINAIIETYGSVQEYYNYIAKQSKESFPHLKLLQEYVFGKPKETIEIEQNTEDDIDYSKISDNALNELINAHKNKP